MNLDFETIKDYLAIIIPFALIYCGLIIYCIVDLFKTDRPIRGNKYIWLFIILFVGTFGPILYLLVGKGE